MTQKTRAQLDRSRLPLVERRGTNNSGGNIFPSARSVRQQVMPFRSN